MLDYRRRYWLRFGHTALKRWMENPTRENLALLARFFSPSRLLETLKPARGWNSVDQPIRLTMLMTPCCWAPFVTPFAHLGKELGRKNINVTFLGGNAGFCSFFGSNADWSEARCREQFDVINDRILGPIGEYRALNDLVTSEILDEAKAWVEDRRKTPILDLEFEGLRVWQTLKGSYGLQRREHVALAREDTIGSRPEIRPLVEGVVINHRVLSQYLESERPDCVMYFSGYFYQERILKKLAEDRGIRTIAHENSSFGDRRIFDSTGIIGNFTSVRERTWPVIKERCLSARQRRRLFRYLDDVFQGRGGTIAQPPSARRDSIRQALKAPNDKPIALFLAQIPYDTVTLYDLPLFQGQLDLIEAVMGVFAEKPDWTLVIRLHPKEAIEGGDRTFHQLVQRTLPANVRLVRGGELNTYDLMNVAAMGITATSQAGLEMLAYKKPLVVAGDAFYGGKGFTWDLGERAALASTIHSAASVALDKRPLNSCRSQQIDSYLYHIIFEHQMRFDPKHDVFPPEAVERIAAMVHGADWMPIG